ncbi:MAG: VanZ family protein, partial [Gammaproteobacteria bacterium]
MNEAPVTLTRFAARFFWLVSILIVYGSLFPFEFSSTPSLSPARFLGTLHATPVLADALGNVGLFLPWGFFAAVAWPRATRMTTLPAFLLASVLFALLLQIAQVFVPHRVPSLLDVLWNVAGASAGLIAAVVLQRSTHFHARWPGTPPISLMLACCWLLSELAPFVPSLDVQHLKDSLKPLLQQPSWTLSDALLPAAGLVACRAFLAEAVPGHRSWHWLLGLAAAALAGKVLIVKQTLELSWVLGLPLGFAAAAAIAAFPRRTQPRVTALFVLASYSVAALSPFEFSDTHARFMWIPFADLLQGSMLNNVQNLLPRLFLLASLTWYCRSRSVLVLGLAGWIAALELSQTQIVGRTPSISDPVWVLILEYLFRGVRKRSRDVPARCATAVGRTSALPGLPAATRPLLFLGSSVSILAAATFLVVRLPGIPYNVRELLRADGGVLSCVAFACAILALGAVSILIAEKVSACRKTMLMIPAWTTAAGCCVLVLLLLGVTPESIADIAGANNLHYFVVHYGIWGDWGATLFRALPGPGIVDAFERPVRFVSLIAPLLIFTALASLFFEAKVQTKKTLGLCLAAVPTLWLCKAIAFDWSSTDNLNELIARPGDWGLGGGGYLYLLVALIAGLGAFVAHHGARRPLASAAFYVTALPVSWWLINSGLEPELVKYGKTFSSLTFLLGPDRSNPLGTEALALRWVIAFSGAMAVLTSGIRIGLDIRDTVHHGPPAAPPRIEVPEGSAATAIAVNLTVAQAAFVRELAMRTGTDTDEVLRNILRNQLEAPESEVSRALEEPRAPATAREGYEALAVGLPDELRA